MGHAYNYIVGATGILLWCILQDYAGDARLAISVCYAGLAFVGLFLLSPNKEKQVFLINWMAGLSSILCFLFAWTGVGNLPFSVSAILFLILALAQLARKWANPDFLGMSWSLAALASAVFFLFVALVADNLLPKSGFYGQLIFSVYFFVDLLRLFYLKGTCKQLYATYWLLFLCSVILMDRRWEGLAATRCFLIILPVLGICAIELIRYMRLAHHSRQSQPPKSL